MKNGLEIPTNTLQYLRLELSSQRIPFTHYASVAWTFDSTLEVHLGCHGGLLALVPKRARGKMEKCK